MAMRARRSRSIRPMLPSFQRAHVRWAISPSGVRASISLSYHARNRFTVVRARAAASSSVMAGRSGRDAVGSIATNCMAHP